VGSRAAVRRAQAWFRSGSCWRICQLPLQCRCPPFSSIMVDLGAAQWVSGFSVSQEKNQVGLDCGARSRSDCGYPAVRGR
jgi:hypothetical protein